MAINVVAGGPVGIRIGYPVGVGRLGGTPEIGRPVAVEVPISRPHASAGIGKAVVLPELVDVGVRSRGIAGAIRAFTGDITLAHVLCRPIRLVALIVVERTGPQIEPGVEGRVGTRDVASPLRDAVLHEAGRWPHHGKRITQGIGAVAAAAEVRRIEPAVVSGEVLAGAAGSKLQLELPASVSRRADRLPDRDAGTLVGIADEQRCELAYCRIEAGDCAGSGGDRSRAANEGGWQNSVQRLWSHRNFDKARERGIGGLVRAVDDGNVAGG